MEVNMSQDLLITLVPYIVPVIIIFATSIAAAAYQRLLRWLPPNQRDMLEYAMSRAVHTVEQVIPGEASTVKKHKAEIRVAEILRTFQVSIPAEVIDSSIEAAVHALATLSPPINQGPTVDARFIGASPPGGSALAPDAAGGNHATGKMPTVASRFIEATYGGSLINQDATVARDLSQGEPQVKAPIADKATAQVPAV